ncbi:hypothetical protein Hanom_Chr02g00102041 [Helianthus anomalus]
MLLNSLSVPYQPHRDQNNVLPHFLESFAPWIYLLELYSFLNRITFINRQLTPVLDCLTNRLCQRQDR